MGMFDYVKYEAPCFHCGEPLTEWQTKSAKDGEDLMRNLEISDVAANFYENCDKCDAWNEYDITTGTPRLKEQHELDTYQRLPTTNHGKEDWRDRIDLIWSRAEIPDFASDAKIVIKNVIYELLADKDTETAAILHSIQEEIEARKRKPLAYYAIHDVATYNEGLDAALQVLDKHKKS